MGKKYVAKLQVVIEAEFRADELAALLGVSEETLATMTDEDVADNLSASELAAEVEDRGEVLDDSWSLQQIAEH